MKSLALLATYRCNMNCVFCLFHDRLNTDSIRLSLLNNALKQAAQIGYDSVALTGGEPCLHPQFNRLVEVVVSNGFSFGIASNGYDYDDYIPLLEYGDGFKYITFSLESHEEAIHDRLRSKGSYGRAVEAIGYFSGRVDVKASICLNTENHGHVEEYILFADSLGIRDIRFMSVIPTPRNGHLVLTDEQRKTCCQGIDDLTGEVEAQLRIMSSLATAAGVDFCSALDLSGLAINPKGELIFCCDIGGKGATLGSLEHEKFEYLARRGEEVSAYLRTSRKNCLEAGRVSDGFGTCNFCNRILREQATA